MEVHPDQEVQVATLIADKAPVAIPAEYLDSPYIANIGGMRLCLSEL